MNKTKSFIIIMILLITAGTELTTAYASHGSGSGGSCDSCTPPTLGVDQNGRTVVNGGISINSIPFDVELFSQTIPVQILNKDEKSIITLKISDDDGTNSVTHAELHFGPYEKVISGVLVEHSIAHLVWHNEYGDEITGIYDDNDILQNVIINATNTDAFKIIRFEFKPTVTMDETSLMTRIWDERKNVANNYFFDAIKVIDVSNFELTQTNSTQLDIPIWIKNNAKWWVDGSINDDAFVVGIEFLIKEGIIHVPKISNPSEQQGDFQEIPDWIKSSAEWWSQELISDGDFINSIQYLIEKDIIKV